MQQKIWRQQQRSEKTRLLVKHAAPVKTLRPWKPKSLTIHNTVAIQIQNIKKNHCVRYPYGHYSDHYSSTR